MLDDLWKRVLLKGRCWGPRTPNNPFRASNITMGEETELVSVSQLPDGTLVVHEFCKALGGTKLGNEVRKKLKDAGLPVQI